MEEFLQLKNINFSYHTKNGEVLAIKNLNLQIHKNEFVTIVGPSGCGKTTILSLIASLHKDFKGEILFNGKVLDKTSKIGYMLQKDCLFEWRTIYKNVMLPLELNKNLKTKENIERVENLLKKYGLYEFRNKFPSQLSGGMRQRAALIRTLAIKPDILLLDEPFSALDYQTKLDVIDDVYSIIKNEKQTAISVSHDISEAISMSDKVVVLTKRPATIKKECVIEFDKTLTPLKRRENVMFAKYFDEIYKEITNEKQL